LSTTFSPFLPNVSGGVLKAKINEKATVRQLPIFYFIVGNFVILKYIELKNKNL